MNSYEAIPKPSDKRIALRVKPAAERALRKGHPWLFDKAILRQSREGRPGDLAVIFDKKDRFLAIGLYDPLSPIRVRVLQHYQPAAIDREWYKNKLEAALQLRAGLPATLTTGYRILHGENDGLPGLVIDRYAGNYVLRLDTAAWMPHLIDVIAVLQELMPVERLVLRLSRTLQRYPDALYGLMDGHLLLGPPMEKPVLFLENGLQFEADLVYGQKTGFFLDQRENRARVEKLITTRGDIKHVLNVFSYSGGFSVYAARGGAVSVISLDANEVALAGAVRNFQYNGMIPAVAQIVHETLLGDAFQMLEQLQRLGRLFDMIIIDPPSFAKRQTELRGAMKAYRQLLKSGLSLIRPGGILVMASCSSRLQPETFFNLLNQTALSEGRPLQEIVRTGHPCDHPVTFSEGTYLKCLFAVVN